MPERIARDNWVEIQAIVLAAGERAPQVPDDTQKVPLEMRVRGFLQREASLGEEAEIRTAAGRRLKGTLSAVNPGYGHGFGRPVPALSAITAELRAILSLRDRQP